MDFETNELQGDEGEEEPLFYLPGELLFIIASLFDEPTTLFNFLVTSRRTATLGKDFSPHFKKLFSRLEVRQYFKSYRQRKCDKQLVEGTIDLRTFGKGTNFNDIVNIQSFLPCGNREGPQLKLFLPAVTNETNENELALLNSLVLMSSVTLVTSYYVNRLTQSPFLFESLSFVNGQKQGTMSRIWLPAFATNQKKRECNYYQDKLQGPFQSYHANGNIRHQCAYNQGTKSGEEKYFFEDGTLSLHCFWQDGLRQGDVRVFWKNGNLRIISPWRDNRRHGKEIFYFDNGNLSKEIDYLDGLRSGTFITYYKESGCPATSCTYTKGVCNGSLCIHKDSQLANINQLNQAALPAH